MTLYNLTNFQDCIGTFKYQDYTDNITALRTEGLKYYYNHTGSIPVIPGQLVTIPLSIKDEFGHTTKDVLIVQEEGGDTATIFTNNVTRVFGRPMENGSLLFKTQNSFRSSYYNISITFLKCPPGFYFDPKAKSCNCSADNSKYAYDPIVRCDYTTFRALILKGYWVGTCDDVCTNDTRLYVSYHSMVTPFIWHRMSVSVSHTLLYELPPAVEGLNSFMCGENRKGVLCGRCQKTLVAYYHSRNYNCGSRKYCHLGILFFFLSEIIPVVVTFSIILRFNVSFQSGYLNGLVLFCQVVDVSAIKLGKLNHCIDKTFIQAFRYIQHGYQLFYDVFNLEFFGIEPLSFCPWKGASVMDVIACKYITTIFTFILVFVLVRIMNSRCHGRNVVIQHPVVKGLSAFLILSYSQCTKITFQILSREVITSNEGSSAIPVTAYGGLRYFHSDHLVYAVPALICLLTVVFLPVLYLLIIPLLLQLLSMCGLSEHIVINKLLIVLHQPKLIPLIDIFQSSFKPKFRFFAGVYFAYRIVIFAVLTFSESEAQFYAVSELVFLAMLGLHAIAHPYKHKKNNVVDGLLFLNLAIINGLNISVNTSSNVLYSEGSPSLPIFVTFVQLLLVTSPLVIIVCGHLIAAAMEKYNRQRVRDNDYEDLETRSLPSQEDMEDLYAGSSGSSRHSLLDTY